MHDGNVCVSVCVCIYMYVVALCSWIIILFHCMLCNVPCDASVCTFIVIATSGIDYNVKLWEPVAFQEASLSDLDEVSSLCTTVHYYSVAIPWLLL